MKRRSILLIAGVLVMFAAITAVAQPHNDHIKILRTPQPGVLKVLYGKDISEPVDITFLTKDGAAGSDRVEGNFPKGFQKRYNVNRIAASDFWIEVKSPSMTALYKVAASKDRRYFTYHLERATYVHQSVARR